MQLDKIRLLEIVGLFVAGLGTLFAGYGILQQTRLTEVSLTAHAYERLNSLRGTSVNVLNDWSGARLVSEGHKPADWPLQGLTLIGSTTSESEVAAINFVNAPDRDHSGGSYHRLNLIFSGSAGSDFSSSKFWTTKFSGPLVQMDFENATFVDVDFSEVTSFRETSFRNARFIKSNGSDGEAAPASLQDFFSLQPDENDSRIAQVDFRGTLFEGYQHSIFDFKGACLDETTAFRVGGTTTTSPLASRHPFMRIANAKCEEIDRRSPARQQISESTDNKETQSEIATENLVEAFVRASRLLAATTPPVLRKEVSLEIHTYTFGHRYPKGEEKQELISLSIDPENQFRSSVSVLAVPAGEVVPDTICYGYRDDIYRPIVEMYLPRTDFLGLADRLYKHFTEQKDGARVPVLVKCVAGDDSSPPVVSFEPNLLEE